MDDPDDAMTTTILILLAATTTCGEQLDDDEDDTRKMTTSHVEGDGDEDDERRTNTTATAPVATHAIMTVVRIVFSLRFLSREVCRNRCGTAWGPSHGCLRWVSRWGHETWEGCVDMGGEPHVDLHFGP